MAEPSGNISGDPTRDLAGIVARFAGVLHSAGVPVGPDRAARFARAVTVVSPRSVPELRSLAHATLAFHHAHDAVLDRVFDAVFAGFLDPADSRGDQNAPLTEALARASTQIPPRYRSVSAGPSPSGSDPSTDDSGSKSEKARDEGQGRLLRWGLVLVVLLVITGSGAVLRAIHRELAVARLQSDFVAAVSHEFRSPLTTLHHLTDLLHDDRVRSEERRKRYYQVLASEIARRHRLVEDLLDFGRMEAGKRRYRLEELDAVALVDAAVADFRQEAESIGFQVDLRTDVSRALVAADAEALRRALWNLLDNAMKYSPERRAVWVTITQEPGRLAVHVRDEGMGISPADQRRIFRKFERGSAARAASIRGTGLGLAMVQGIMRAHGGGVLLDSKPPCGSTFTLWLPLAA